MTYDINTIFTKYKQLTKSIAKTELPISIFTSLLGAPFLIYLILAKREEDTR